MENLYLKVNLSKIEKNISIIRNILGNKKIIAVVKGDAYGLGLEKICDFLEDKVDMFGVSNLEEAIKLYEMGIQNEIMILTPIISEDYFQNEFIEKFTITIDNFEILSSIPKDLNINVHIYVCTGMNRKGIKLKELHNFINYIENEYKNINIKGIYTHLHNVKDEEYTLNQIHNFHESIKVYEDKYFIHILNSGGFINEKIRNKASFSHGVRIGNLIYGYDGLNIGIEQSFSYYAKVLGLYDVKKGENVGYGNKVKLKNDMKIGILEIGNIQHFGFYREYRKSFLYDVLKFVYRYFVKAYEIYKDDMGIKIIGRSNMNLTLIDGNNLCVGDYVKINISPILGDSSIYKKYIY